MKLDSFNVLMMLLMTIVMQGCSSVEQQQDSDAFLDDMVTVMSTMKEYTLAVYDIPADSNMDFRPTDEVMSFQEHAAHMLSNMYLQDECFVKRDSTTSIDWVMEDVAAILAIQDRAALRAKLVSQFDQIITDFEALKGKQDWNKDRSLPQFDGKPRKDLITIAMMMRDHITHHRAQMIVYLRLMGHEPPRYKPF